MQVGPSGGDHLFRGSSTLVRQVDEAMNLANATVYGLSPHGLDNRRIPHAGVHSNPASR